MKRAIIIMAKVPQAGNVKTRLQNILSPEDCESLAESFLKDAVNKANSACKNVFIAFFPRAEIQKIKKILPDESNFIEQTGENLGEKMYNAFQFLFEQKADSIVMIGTDSPTFPFDYIEQAFEFLETNSEVVLGRTEDGGFYLIGLRILRPEIFENVVWSSPKTFEQVFENIRNLKLYLRETPGWYDVDEEQDLILLKKEIMNNQNARRRAPQTFEWLKQNFPV
ncbi:MAG: TIGR04282 family arsenosugar biosynthesis glycosyltransferase [Actinomycetota bacterium]